MKIKRSTGADQLGSYKLSMLLAVQHLGALSAGMPWLALCVVHELREDQLHSDTMLINPKPA